MSDNPADTATEESSPGATAAPALTLKQALALAAEHHRERRFAAAAEIYRQIHEAMPNNAEVVHHLGLIAYQQNRIDDALRLMTRALELEPDNVDFRSNLGGVLRRAGRLREAAEAYCRVLEQRPGHAEAHNNLGVVLRDLHRPDEAASAYRRAIRLKPDYVEAHYNLGNALKQLGEFDEAIAAYRQAIELRPNYAEAYNNLGNAFRTLGRSDEAVAAYRSAIEARPGYADAYNNCGIALRELGRLDEAEAAYRQAIALRPGFANAHNNLGVALKEAGRFEQALDAFRRAVELQPDHADARCNLGMSLLLRGDLPRGWRENEWRWRAGSAMGAREFPQPPWQGQAVATGTLLLWGEQGIGDEILYAGMVEDALRLAPRIVLECAPRLTPLFARSFPAVEVIPRRDPSQARARAPDIVCQAAMGSLGRFFRASPENFPERQAYLLADSDHVAMLRSRYRQDGDGMVVGISWRSKNARMGAAKTTELAAWAPVLRVPGVSFVNLQYGDCAEELARVESDLGVAIRHDPEVDSLRDLDAFAAQVAAMDLVLSVSNTTVHMAGALGVPVWTMLPEGQGQLWYWFERSERSPWYPCMRLLRQAKPGEWAPVIERAARELAALSDKRQGAAMSGRES